VIVHRKQRASTLEMPGSDGRFGMEQQIWAVQDRAPVDGGGEALLRVPVDAAGLGRGPGPAVNLRVMLDERLAGLRRGARIAGTVTTGEGGDARSVEAWLQFAEDVPGFHHVAGRTEPVRLHDGPLPPGHALRLALRLPADALPSLETEWGALRWTLVVRVDRPLRPDVRTELDLDVRA
jgi:hypothetical protein